VSTRAADELKAAAALQARERRLVAQPPGLARTLGSVLVLMRPRQWVKNLLVLAAPLFAARLFDAAVLSRSLLTLVAFCAASSAVYVYNDIRDATLDRLHPLKSRRPMAAGLATPGFALTLSAALVVVGLLVGLAADPRVSLLVAAYVVLMLVYCELGRSRAPIDVFIIAAGFLLRALAGAAAGQVTPSPWFLALTLLLALMLGFGKRRAELSLVAARGQPSRPSLETYSVAMLDQLLSVLAASIIVLYAIYAVSITTRIGSSDMILTWPLVLFAVIRYLQVSHVNDRPPDELMVTDRVILGSVLTYAGVAAAVLHFHTHLISQVSLG
jgi:decaprenyl-phosphate phosphoribosyltransferase